VIEALVALFALIGLLAVIVVCGIGFALWLLDSVEEADPDPYREGLDASARISAMAFEAERTMHQIAQQEEPGEES
jgi:hypothetical protein